MTDTPEMNRQMFLVAGESATGKSAALRNIKNQERWAYMNAEAGKRLPFKNKFMELRVEDPYQVYDAFEEMIKDPGMADGVIIDSITFLMDMFETQHVLSSNDTQKAWGQYAQFFKHLMQNLVVRLNKPVIVIGHTKDQLDEKEHVMKSSVPIKGALKNQGVEAYFSTVVGTKRMTLKDLEPYKSELLSFNEEEKDLGFKHVFQTRLTKKTIGERIRSPMGLFTKEQTFMDNDAALLLGHLNRYYA